jgi:hypothetical protein
MNWQVRNLTWLTDLFDAAGIVWRDPIRKSRPHILCPFLLEVLFGCFGTFYHLGISPVQW